MRKLVILAMVLFSTGCAFTLHDVNVDYKYDKPLEFSFTPKTLEIGDINDERGVENPRLITNKANLYGPTSGGWQAEKPLNEIVKDAVVQGLSSSAIKISESGSELKLSGGLLAFDVEIITGFWKVSYKGEMTAKFQLVDQDSGDIFWRDTFVGRSQVKGEESVVDALKAAIDDLMNKFLNDSYFQQEIRK